MSSAPPDAPESSRGGHQQAEDAAAVETSGEAPVPPQRRWVVLSSIPARGYRATDRQRGRILPHRDLRLNLHDPPRLSSLELRANLTTLLFTIIDVADSSTHRLFIRAAERSSLVINRPAPEYFICDTAARTATRLADPPPDFNGVSFCPNRTIGLIADPDSRGHFLVAQLHPIPANRHRLLLFYTTANRQWGIKTLASGAPEHKQRWGGHGHGVLAHDGLLWWVDIAYGMLVCNPFDDRPRLRLVPLPAPCALQDVEPGSHRRYLLDQRRCIRPSEGKLRYVEIRGFSYDTAAAAAEPPIDPAVWVWTLVDPDRPEDPWELEYEAPFAEIWAHDSYVDAGLPPGEVPNVAFVDPNNHGVVYFFQGSRLFGLDVRGRRVVACGECVIDNDYQNLRLQSSGFVHAWVPPPGDHPSDESNQQILSFDEKRHREVLEYVDEWLNQLVLTSQVEPGDSSDEPIEDMAPPSESSPDPDDALGHQQADDEP